MNQKTKTILGWALTGLLDALFAFSAFGKLTGAEEAVKGFQDMKLSETHLLIAGLIEVSGIALFAYPRTGVLGTLLLMAYMGATVFAHFQIGQPIVLNLVIAVAIVLTGNLRFPEIGNRLLGK